MAVIRSAGSGASKKKVSVSDRARAATKKPKVKAKKRVVKKKPKRVAKKTSNKAKIAARKRAAAKRRAAAAKKKRAAAAKKRKVTAAKPTKGSGVSAGTATMPTRDTSAPSMPTYPTNIMGIPSPQPGAPKTVASPAQQAAPAPFAPHGNFTQTRIMDQASAATAPSNPYMPMMYKESPIAPGAGTPHINGPANMIGATPAPYTPTTHATGAGTGSPNVPDTGMPTASTTPSAKNLASLVSSGAKGFIGGVGQTNYTPGVAGSTKVNQPMTQQQAKLASAVGSTDVAKNTSAPTLSKQNTAAANITTQTGQHTKQPSPIRKAQTTSKVSTPVKRVSTPTQQPPVITDPVQPQGDYAMDHVLVKFDEGMWNEGYGGENVFGNWYKMPVGEGELPDAALLRYGSMPGVLLSELNRMFDLPVQPGAVPLVTPTPSPASPTPTPQPTPQPTPTPYDISPEKYNTLSPQGKSAYDNWVAGGKNMDLFWAGAPPWIFDESGSGMDGRYSPYPNQIQPFQPQPLPQQPPQHQIMPAPFTPDQFGGGGVDWYERIMQQLYGAGVTTADPNMQYPSTPPIAGGIGGPPTTNPDPNYVSTPAPTPPPVQPPQTIQPPYNPGQLVNTPAPPPGQDYTGYVPPATAAPAPTTQPATPPNGLGGSNGNPYGYTAPPYWNYQSPYTRPAQEPPRFYPPNLSYAPNLSF